MNGTVALHIALDLASVQRGDEVISREYMPVGKGLGSVALVIGPALGRLSLCVSIA
jgi:hypothetical protein